MRGRQLPGVPTYDFAKFLKNCMKLKKFGPPGGGIPHAPLRSATVDAYHGIRQRAVYKATTICVTESETSNSVAFDRIH